MFSFLVLLFRNSGFSLSAITSVHVHTCTQPCTTENPTFIIILIFPQNFNHLLKEFSSKSWGITVSCPVCIAFLFTTIAFLVLLQRFWWKNLTSHIELRQRLMNQQRFSNAILYNINFQHLFQISFFYIIYICTQIDICIYNIT